MKKPELHKTIKRFAISFFMVVVAVMIPWQPVSAESTMPFKAGKYYFKYDVDKGRVLYSKKKNKGYKKTPVRDEHYVTTGKDIVFLDNEKIKAYNIASKKIKTLKTLPKAKLYYNLVGYGGKYLWINKTTSSFYLKNTAKLYSYNIKTGRLRLRKKQLVLDHLNGSYYLGAYGKRETVFRDRYSWGDFENEDRIVWEKAYQKMAIYKINKRGKIKRVEKLGKVYAWDDTSAFLSSGHINNLFYTIDDGHDLKQIKYNGENKLSVKWTPDYILEVPHEINHDWLWEVLRWNNDRWEWFCEDIRDI